MYLALPIIFIAEEADEEADSGIDEQTKPPIETSTINIIANRRQKIEEKKVYIGYAATKIIANPDKNVSFN